MANETISSSLAALVATEMLAQQSIKANLPDAVLTSIAHMSTSLDGMRTNQKRYTVESSLGASSGGTENTALTNTFAFSMGTSVNVSPTEGVADLFEITEDAIMRQLGIPFAQLESIIAGEGSVEQYQAILGPYVQRAIARGMRKIEADGLALLSGLSQSVGTSGSDITVSDMLAAIYTYRQGEPLVPLDTQGPMATRFLLTNNQKHEIDVALFATGSGAALANTWTNPANYASGQAAEGVQAQGLRGSFLGYPVHVYSPTLNVTANTGADVVGGFGCFGDPMRAPDDASLGGRCGAFVREVRTPLSFAFRRGLENRSIIGRMNARYAWAEVCDSSAVKIVTDAP